MKAISPSLLSADFGNMKRDVELLNASECDFLHLDIMDGVFVPNISFGIPVVKSIASYAKKPLDAHLMIVEPEKWIDRFADLGVRILTIHYEACTHLNRAMQQMHSRGLMAGVAFNPSTPVSALEEIVCDCDVVLLMSVNPGFGGQTFIPGSLDKISRLKKLVTEKGSKALIEVDGGVSMANHADLFNAGADILVAGNAIFTSADPVAAVETLKS
jgi:ribulose-phosphate 3-epimerase